MKYLESKTLTFFNLIVITLFVVLFTIDFFKAWFHPTDYNFNQYDSSITRHTQFNYLIYSAVKNIVLYVILCIGLKGMIKDNWLKTIFNIITILIYLMIVVGIYLWSKKGYDH
jgi:hypothetical protein